MNKKEFPHKKHLALDIKELIEQSRQQVAVAVNYAMSMLYWQIGKRINEEVLQNQRAAYGKEIVHTLSAQLTTEFGKGWSEKHLRHCLRIAETITDEKNLYAVSRELSWTHLRSIIYIDDKLKRSFYTEMCRLEKWYLSVIDIISTLTDSSIPKRYWTDLKKKLLNEGSELYEKIVQLKHNII